MNGKSSKMNGDMNSKYVSMVSSFYICISLRALFYLGLRVSCINRSFVHEWSSMVLPFIRPSPSMIFPAQRSSPQSRRAPRADLPKARRSRREDGGGKNRFHPEGIPQKYR